MSERVRLSEIVGSLSLATDMLVGQPMEHALRSCILSVRFGELLGLSERELVDVYYLVLLAWIGCMADIDEIAATFGDDAAFYADTYSVDATNLRALAFMLRRAGAHQTPVRRARTVVSLLAEGGKGAERMFRAHCELAEDLALRLGLDSGVRAALQQMYERWDGQGAPEGVKGDDLELPVRLVHIVDVAEVFHRLGGVEAAQRVARDRRGTHFDPSLAAAFCDAAPALFDKLESEASMWDAVMSCEPGDRPTLDGGQLDTALSAVADFVDFRSSFMLGHSRGVAELAQEAALRAGLPEPDAHFLWRAGMVHDLGRAGVGTAIWDKPGPLTDGEWEQVRLHPYLTERILARPPALAEIGRLASMHHERLDGSGYHRGLNGDGLPTTARLLAAADVYAAMTEPRPHRPALTPDDAAATLRSEVRAGRIDGRAADAVLNAAGHRVRRRSEGPAGLTPRELEVLELVARGRSNRETAKLLHISEKTVGNHVEHIYTKIGVSTRAGASLFAIRQGLVGPAGG